jgi:hypothetical protein
MQTFEFTVELDEEFSTKLEDNIVKSCNDGLLYQREGKVCIDFAREALSLQDAQNSTYADLVSASVRVKKIYDILVDT